MEECTGDQNPKMTPKTQFYLCIVTVLQKLPFSYLPKGCKDTSSQEGWRMAQGIDPHLLSPMVTTPMDVSLLSSTGIGLETTMSGHGQEARSVAQSGIPCPRSILEAPSDILQKA